MTKVHAPDFGRRAPTFSGPIGASGTIPITTPARREVDAITIPGLPVPSQFRH